MRAHLTHFKGYTINAESYTNLSILHWVWSLEEGIHFKTSKTTAHCTRWYDNEFVCWERARSPAGWTPNNGTHLMGPTTNMVGLQTMDPSSWVSPPTCMVNDWIYREKILLIIQYGWNFILIRRWLLKGKALLFGIWDFLWSLIEGNCKPHTSICTNYLWSNHLTCI